ncbi:hypothetical protein [Photobacterium nomapromontoriensis]|uniref:hypothetical protein n=1 Tax=Photobacterium nomapromontoriensis TaxID=2910237 RepID=UPI003D0BF62B
MRRIILLTGLLTLSACTTYEVPESPAFNAASTWAIMPMTNNSNTPLAAEKVEQLLNTQLYAKGLNVIMYPVSATNDLQSILDTTAKQKQAQAWLASQPVDYIITGSVEEWHYKSGLDGEPAVGITLEVKSAKNGIAYWRASGSRGGWGRESVSGTGQIVLEELLDGLNVTTNK